MLHIDDTTNVYNKHVHVRVPMYPLTTTSSTIIHIIHYTQCPWQMPKRLPIVRAEFPVACNNSNNWSTLITILNNSRAFYVNF